MRNWIRSGLRELTRSGLHELNRFGLPVVSVQFLTQVKQWQGFNWLQGGVADISLLTDDWSSMAFRWGHRRRYKVMNIDWSLSAPGGVTDSYTGAQAFDGAKFWPHVTGVPHRIDFDYFTGTITNESTPIVIPQDWTAVPMTPNQFLAASLHRYVQPYTNYPTTPGLANSGWGFAENGDVMLGGLAATAASWTALTLTRNASDFTVWIPNPISGTAYTGDLTQTMALNLINENEYLNEAGTGVLQAALARFTSEARSAAWSGLGWINVNNYPFPLGGGGDINFVNTEQWKEYGNVGIGAEADADLSTYAYNNLDTPPIAGGVGDYFLGDTGDLMSHPFSIYAPATYPITSPLAYAGPDSTLDQTEFLASLCSYWVYPSLEEINCAGAWFQCLTPFVLKRCRFKVDKPVNYWIGEGDIPRCFSAGSGPWNIIQPMNVTVVSSGTASPGTPVEIPCPAAGEFVSLSDSGLTWLSVGKVRFAVLGESPEDWSARTGITINP